MKKFLTLCAALCCSAMAFAQFPSSANWTEGQDISKDLADQGLWGDYSGTWEAGGVTKDGAVTQTPNPSPWWKGDQPNELALTATSDPETNPYPCVGFYKDGAGGSLPDMYQIIPLPAGYYEVKVNAVYREGTPADTWTSYAAGNPKRNAHLYVNTLTSEDPEAILASYDRPINTLPFSIIKDGARYTGEDSGTSWKTDGKYTWTKDGVEDSCFYPCCDEGAALHFKEGNYEHALKFILLEDGYIRLGLKKSANISQDWFPWANMRIIYQGVADEDAQIDLAFEAYGDALDQIEALKERIENEGFGALYAMLDDAQMEIEDAVEETLESANESTAKLLALREQFEAAFASAKALGDLISMSDDMAVATDFPTHAEFEEAIEAAKAVAFAEDPADINYDPANYTAAFNALSAARANYLDSQDFDEDGNKDFTMLIKYPWFVNAEYNPEYLPVDGNEATKAWQLTEATWADRGALGNPGNYVDKVGGRTNIASKVVLSADVEATNQWFKRVNYDGWSPGLQLYYQSCLVGPSSGWNSISGGSEEICQQLVGLPNGYYSLRALMRGDTGAGWTAPDGEKTFHNIYAMNSDSTYVKSEPNATKEEANNNMSNGWYEWNPLAWTEHRTGIIQVSDGKLLIAAQTTNVMNATGFRLYFHGANPQFDNMIQPDIEAVQEKALQLTFEGDKTYVQGLLDQIVLPIGTDATIYEADLAIIKQANEYIKAALDATSDKNFTAPSDFVALQGKYAADADQFAMLQLPTDYAIALGTNEGDTYDMAPAANKLYKAYEAYFAIYDKALNYQTQEVATVIAEQTEYLKANMATVELLEEYTAALAGPMNQAIFNELAAFDATEENPVNITSLLVNPELTKSPTEGWTCAEATPSINTYGRGNAELWNASAFDLYQEIKYLPAGKYEFRARALYRDAAAVDSAHYADYKAAGDEAAWKNHNALIYANNGKADQSNYIKAVHSAQKTEPSFTSWYNMEGFDEYTNAGFVSNWNGNVCIFEDELFDEHKNDLETLADCVVNMGDDYDEKCHGENIFDTPIVDGETTYYFPSSMAGFYFLLQNDKEVYNNSVKTVLPEGNTLRVGLKKTAAIGSDWVIYDDFELYYLGPEDFVDEPNNEYNLIADDASFGFNDGTVGQWHYLGWNNGGTATNVAPGYGNSAGAMALTSTNPAGDPWGAQLLCPLKEGAKLEIGKTYTVSFWAKGTVEGDYIAPGAGGWPNPEWNNAEPAVLSTDWQQFSYTLVCDESNTAADGNTQIYFNQGKLTGTAYVDRICVFEIADEPNVPGNLLADDSYGFNDGTVGQWHYLGWNNGGTATNVAPGYGSSAGAMALTSTNPAGDPWGAQLLCSLKEGAKLERGKTYTVSFWAKGTVEGDYFAPGAGSWPNPEWNNAAPAVLTTEWQQFTYTLVCDESNTAEDGNTQIYFNQGKLTGTAYVDRIVVLGEGGVAGDANTDGEVNVSDIAAVANYILGEEVDPFDAVAADCDESGEIDVTDISAIAQIILTAEPEESKVKTILAAAEGSATLTLSADEVVAGQEFTLNVDLNNAEDAICGVQADIYLPEGLEFVLDEYDEPTVEGGRSSKITTECALQGNGALRILCYSAKNYTYTGTEGAVATIAVKAADTFSAGDIVMKKIVLSSYNNKKVAQIKPADFTLPVSIADAINGINSEIANGLRINAAGQAVNNSYKGIVIMNGKKVLVK